MNAYEPTDTTVRIAAGRRKSEYYSNEKQGNRLAKGNKTVLSYMKESLRENTMQYH